MKPIALVLLNYNGIELLKKFLNDVISNSLEADIVLIDNNFLKLEFLPSADKTM
jgi:hypothetical protein